jgi:hypothetical protein
MQERKLIMQQKVIQFLTELSQNPEMREAFKNDPDACMDAAGLSNEEKDVLKSGDPDKIRSHLGDDAPPGVVVILLA